MEQLLPEKLIIDLIVEDVRECKEYSDNYDCAIARALRRVYPQLEKSQTTVGTNHCYLNGIKYHIVDGYEWFKFKEDREKCTMFFGLINRNSNSVIRSISLRKEKHEYATR